MTLTSRAAVTVATIALLGSPSLIASASAAPAAQSRHQRAVAYAQKLLAKAPTADGETALSAPPHGMRRAPMTDGDRGVVTRSEFWTSDESMRATYNALAGQSISGMHADGSGSTGRYGQTRELMADDEANHLPRNLADGELVVAVRRDGSEDSYVGVYAEAVPFPKRKAAEHVPTPITSATLTRSASGKPTETRTLTEAQAEKLANVINSLQVSPSGPRPCPAINPDSYGPITVNFTVDEQTWTSDESCGWVTLSRGNHSFPNLQPTAQIGRLLSRDWKADRNQSPDARSGA